MNRDHHYDSRLSIYCDKYRPISVLSPPASSVSSTVGENLSGSSGYASSSAVASSSKTSLQIQQTAGGYGSEGSKVQVATGQAYHHPQHAANTPPPPNALAAYMANLAGQQTLGGAPVAAPQAAYPSYLPTMMQPTTGHHLLQQLQVRFLNSEYFSFYGFSIVSFS